MAAAHWVILFSVVMIASTTLGGSPLFAGLALCVPVLLRGRVLLLLLGLLVWFVVALDVERGRRALLPAALAGQVSDISGHVAGLPQCLPAGFGDQQQRARFDVLVDGGALAPWPGVQRVRLSWYLSAQQCAMLLPGQRWQLRVRWHQRPNGDAALRALRTRIQGRGTVVTGHRATPASAPLSARIDRWRQSVSERLRRVARHHVEASAILPALATGDRRGIDSAMTHTLAATGTAHLVAISGLHISLVLLLVLAVLRRPLLLLARRWPVAQHVLPLLALSAASLYAAMAGFAVATSRALMMAALLLILTHAGRRLPAFTLLWLALLLLLLGDPLLAASPGLWMSVSAVFLLMLFGRRQIGLLRGQSLLSVGLSPLAAWWFAPPGLGAWLANLLLVPLFSVLIIPLVLLAAVLDPALLLVPLLGDGLGWVWVAVESLARWPRVPVPGSLLLALAWTVALLLLCLPGVGLPRAPALLLLLPLSLPLWQRPALGEFSLHVFDVGQGSAQVVATRNQLLLFDAGPSWPGGAAAEQYLLPWLRHQPQPVTRAVVSHGDADHAGGLSVLRPLLPATQLWSGEPDRVAGTRGCHRGQRWSADGVDFTVLWPPPRAPLRHSNNRSCVLHVAGRSRSLLLSGDITRAVEYALVRAGLGPVDIMQMPHHGSGSSSSYPFLNALKAKVAYANTGAENRFGHPRGAIVSRYRGQGVRVFDTGRQGSLQWLPQTPLLQPRSSLDQQWRSPWRWVSPVVE